MICPLRIRIALYYITINIYDELILRKMHISVDGLQERNCKSEKQSNK